MAFNLQQVVIPVAVLGPQQDPAEVGALSDWLDYFAIQVGAMIGAMPCKRWVRVSLDVAQRMYGDQMPQTDETAERFLLTQCGTDRLQLELYLDRALAVNTVRLE